MQIHALLRFARVSVHAGQVRIMGLMREREREREKSSRVHAEVNLGANIYSEKMADKKRRIFLNVES